MLNDRTVSHCGQGKARTELQGGQSAWETGGGTVSPPHLQGIVGLASFWEDAALPSHAWARASWDSSPRGPECLWHENNTLLLEQERKVLEGRKLALLTKLWQSVVLPTAQGLLQMISP